MSGPWIAYQDHQGNPCWQNSSTGEWAYSSGNVVPQPSVHYIGGGSQYTQQQQSVNQIPGMVPQALVHVIPDED